MADTDTLPRLPALDEKLEKRTSDEIVHEKDSPSSPDSEKVSYVAEDDALGDALYVNGEPVVQGGMDVSRFVVDLRDDGDEPLTFRALVLGTIFGGLGAGTSHFQRLLRVFFVLTLSQPCTRYVVHVFAR